MVVVCKQILVPRSLALNAQVKSRMYTSVVYVDVYHTHTHIVVEMFGS